MTGLLASLRSVVVARWKPVKVNWTEKNSQAETEGYLNGMQILKEFMKKFLLEDVV